MSDPLPDRIEQEVSRRIVIQLMGGTAGAAVLGSLAGCTSQQNDAGQEQPTETEQKTEAMSGEHEEHEEEHKQSTVENLQIFLVENFHWGFIPRKLLGEGSVSVGDGGQGSEIHVSQGDTVVLVGWNNKSNHERYEQLEHEYEDFYKQKYGEETVEEFEQKEEEDPELNEHVLEVVLGDEEVATHELKPGLSEAYSALAFTAEQTGEYTMKCDHFCGFGHGDMRGKIIVG